jgi:hypothetical protein
MKHLIDTDKTHKLPYDDWKVESHQGVGKVDWSKLNPELYFSEKQKDGYIQGEDLLKELDGKNPLNANVLWYLLDHQELIPKEWNDKDVYFFGTVFLSPDGYRCVLCLCRDDDGSWDWDDRWLGDVWGARGVSAVSRQVPLPSLDSFNLEISEVKINNKVYRLVD